MNNHVSPEAKNGVIKWLAIIGFIGVIILAVWLAVQIVRVLPTAFSSLASLAGSVASNQPVTTLAIETEDQTVQSGEAFEIAWNDVRRDGTYTFSYSCTPNAALTVVLSDDSKEVIECDEELAIPNGLTLLTLIPLTENERYTDIEYMVAFYEAGTEKHLFERTGTITVLNGSATGSVATDTPTTPATPGVPHTPSKPTTPTPGKPVTTTYDYSYIPESDPKGSADLAITYVSPKTIDADDEATIKIMVKNLGTKTSKDFDVKVELPNGSEYELEDERGLKPNEHLTLTIEFDASDLSGTERIEGRVSVSDDKTSGNNSFRETVRFED